jgi:hypothetical protein
MHRTLDLVPSRAKTKRKERKKEKVENYPFVW